MFFFDPDSMANVLAAHEIEALDGFHIYHDGSVDEIIMCLMRQKTESCVL